MSNPRTLILDNDFDNDIRIRALAREYGKVAYGLIVRLWARLNRESGRMEEKYMLSLGHDLDETEADWSRFVTLCVTHGLLKCHAGVFFVSRLERDAASVKRKQEQWVERQRKRRERLRVSRVTGGVTSEQEQEQEQEGKGECEGKPQKEPIDPDGHVLMTQPEAERLVKTLGPEQFDYLVASAADFAKTKPKQWKSYKNHAAFIRNQARYKREKGQVFFQHPRDGPGFFPSWLVEKLEREKPK